MAVKLDQSTPSYPSIKALAATIFDYIFLFFKFLFIFKSKHLTLVYLFIPGVAISSLYFFFNNILSILF